MSQGLVTPQPVDASLSSSLQRQSQKLWPTPPLPSPASSAPQSLTNHRAPSQSTPAGFAELYLNQPSKVSGVDGAVLPHAFPALTRSDQDTVRHLSL